MLSTTTQLLLLGACIFVMLFITVKIKKGRLKLKYGLPWYAVTFVIFILAAFPKLIHRISELIGIHDPVNMLFLFGFVYLMILLYKLTASVSRLSDKVKKLTQEAAIHDKCENKEKGNE